MPKTQVNPQTTSLWASVIPDLLLLPKDWITWRQQTYPFLVSSQFASLVKKQNYFNRSYLIPQKILEDCVRFTNHMFTNSIFGLLTINHFNMLQNESAISKDYKINLKPSFTNLSTLPTSKKEITVKLLFE